MIVVRIMVSFRRIITGRGMSETTRNVSYLDWSIPIGVYMYEHVKGGLLIVF